MTAPTARLVAELLTERYGPKPSRPVPDDDYTRRRRTQLARDLDDRPRPPRRTGTGWPE